MRNLAQYTYIVLYINYSKVHTYYSTGLQTIVDGKEAGSSLVAAATAAGERLQPNTAADGRETVRQQLRHLKESWDTIHEDITSCQRQLDMSELQWTSFKDSVDQLQSWLTGMDGQLCGYASLHATLDEKKSQLSSCKVRWIVCW